MDWNAVAERLLEPNIWVPMLIAVGIVLSVIFKSVTSMFVSIARERTRREIAAYIAEGSMTPEQGERLMKADKPETGSCC
jgi:hypothetical protein